MRVLTMDELDLAQKRVLIREDLNVPLKNGQITSTKRIEAALPTIRRALSAGAKVILISHLGRPEAGVYNSEFSLAPVAKFLAKELGQDVPVLTDWMHGINFDSSNIVLLENIRFNLGEEENSPELSKKLAALCDIFVMDAFGTAHRKQASTYGVAEFAPIACAGPLLISELNALAQALENPTRPLVAIVGGSKVSSKLEVLSALSKKVDKLIVGGGIANTFIAASGLSVGKSLYEPEQLSLARSLIKDLQNRGGDIPLPIDVVVSQKISADAIAVIKPISKVEDMDLILDIGPDTAKAFSKYIAEAGTIIWNGPVGVFEYDQFAEGTKSIAKAIAESKAFSIAGGGDTLAAIDKFAVTDKISYISTGGGAFLEFVEGKILPAVEILEKRATDKK